MITPRNSVESDGMQDLEKALASSGIIFRANGEPFEDFCVRIASRYLVSVEQAREKLQMFR